jgi:glucosamine--fructose-6-phosphate aminotransferase (isomerizing)
MALEWVSGALLGQSPEQIEKVAGGMIEPVSDYLADWRLHVSSLQERLAGLRHIFLLGRGRSMAAVGAGGLIVKEAARFPIEGMNSSAFRHGPMEMLTPHMLALVMEGDPQCAPLNDSLLATIKSQGNFAELIGPSAPLSALRLPPCPLRHRPTLEILPVQMITFALAALSGREAGVFAHLTKVTTVE